jgi:hypothetical protein
MKARSVEELLQDTGQEAVSVAGDDLAGRLLVYAGVRDGVIPSDLLYKNLEGDEAALEINQAPCAGRNGCAVNLPRMLPPGGTLHIYGPDGYYKPWVGAPDS